MTADAALLERFLGVDAQRGISYLDQTADGRYQLTPEGRQHGAVAHEFANITQPGRGECGADCWCKASPDEADACLAGRLGESHNHSHETG